MPAAYWAIDRRHGSQLHRWGLGYVVEVWLVKLVRVILAEITPSDLPFVVGFGQQGADPAQDSGSIRKDLHRAGAEAKRHDGGVFPAATSLAR
jgi:hypothetical protein